MLSYVTQTLVEYFRHSTQFYYIIFGPSAEVLYTNPLFEKNKALTSLLPHDLIIETIYQCKHNPRKNVPIETILNDDAGTIDAPVGRYAEEKLWNTKADGKRAVTNFWVKERFSGKTLLELEPVTGRTNQLRIHLAHIGYPILGDITYGGGAFPRLCLHAYKLVFWHPNGGKRLEVEAKIESFI